MLRVVGSRRSLGVAIGSTAIHVPGVGSQAVAWSRPIEPPSGDGSWASLADALRQLRAERPGCRTLSVALLAPLVDVRPLTLPPLSQADARHVIARNAGRYFVGARDPQVIGLELPPRRSGRAARPVIAAAASARLVDALHAAARAAGWTVDTVVPAEAAWRAAALAMWPSLRRGSHDVAVARSGRTQILHFEEGALVSIRRFGDASGGVSALNGELREDAGALRGDVVVFGPRDSREVVSSAMRATGARVVALPARWDVLAESPEGMAAAFADARTGLELVAESVWETRRARRKQLTTIIGVAAVVMFAVAATLEWWGLRRELEYVRRERAALHPKVAALMATRDSAAVTDQRLQDLAAERGASISWSAAFVTLTRALPLDAHLTAFRADGDSLVIEGLADRAGDVFTAIDGTPGFAGVRSAAPVRRELGDRQATDVAEHFSVAARVVPSDDSITIAAKPGAAAAASVAAPVATRP